MQAEDRTQEPQTYMLVLVPLCSEGLWFTLSKLKWAYL